MENIHLWQYIVIAGPAAVLGGLVVWALNREYTRGLEDVVINTPIPMPEIIIPRIPKEFSRVLHEVLAERIRQDAKWGQQNHDMADYYTILGEEFGEVGKAICEHRLQNKHAAPIREELIQTAAVAVAMVEAFDRQGAL